MNGPVAILGANGFIGSRLVEMMCLNDWAEPRAIVRRLEALASAKRFQIEGRLANALDQTALEIAFRGCETVVHAIAGDPNTILGAIAPAYGAAQAAGVRRIVYLSTASVHGQSPPPGTTEETPLTDTQPVEYNNAKVRAEWRLRQLRKQGSVEIVLLRPGIVYGPRSYWIGGFADELAAGDAYLVEGGRGICNSANVDNVVHAIHLAMRTTRADGQAYFVTDAETVTWSDLLGPVAEALGYDLASISVRAPVNPSRPIQFREKLLPVLRRFASRFPRPVHRGLQAAYAEWRTPQIQQKDRADAARTHNVLVTTERAHLHCCETKLSFAKANRELGYSPIVSFEEGCQRCVNWLEFAGYPVRKNFARVTTKTGRTALSCP
jgi:nucleoside-diphosphate-sugar epimerase